MLYVYVWLWYMFYILCNHMSSFAFYYSFIWLLVAHISICWVVTWSSGDSSHSFVWQPELVCSVLSSVWCQRWRCRDRGHKPSIGCRYLANTEMGHLAFILEIPTHNRGYNLDLKSWFWSSSTPELAFLLIMEYSYSRISFFANYGVELLHN